MMFCIFGALLIGAGLYTKKTGSSQKITIDFYSIYILALISAFIFRESIMHYDDDNTGACLFSCLAFILICFKPLSIGMECYAHIIHLQQDETSTEHEFSFG